MESLKNFDILGLSRENLKKRIPVQSDGSAIKNSEEAQTLIKDLDELQSIKEKIMGIIDDIFLTLNDDNVIPQFIQVLQNRTTEKAVNFLFIIRFLLKTKLNMKKNSKF